jgi:Methyltransferase domain
MLQYIEGEPRFTILDFGCGPGRDLKVVAELGHVAVGLEGAAHFADMACAYSSCEVWQQDFLKLDLPNNYFDGAFALARYRKSSAQWVRLNCCGCKVIRSFTMKAGCRSSALAAASSSALGLCRRKITPHIYLSMGDAGEILCPY